MNTKIILGNFKAEFTTVQLDEWFEEAARLITQKEMGIDVSVGVTPGFVHLERTKKLIEYYKLPFLIGAQDVSSFGMGPYTGDTPVHVLKGLVDFVIVGHSERRKYYHESHEDMQKKIILLNNAHINVVLCGDEPERFDGSIWVLAYEPTRAIGTGTPEPAVESMQKAKQLAEGISHHYLIYGGSSNAETIQSFILAGFNGVLPGKKCITPVDFFSILHHA